MANDDPYSSFSKGKLNFKSDSSMKKKKKKKDKKILEQQIAKTAEVEDLDKLKKETKAGRTKAECSFKQMQEKNQTKRILEKATMTHKERVEKFNQHLDSLTEHFDIPKVSWTK